jgi:release factor glutamine methyltransferase
VNNVGGFLDQATAQLSSAGVDSARLDVLILLEDELNKDRAWLLAHAEQLIDALSLEKLSTQIERRCAHIPLAYIRRRSEFYGREFYINRHVLTPRPESESIITLLTDTLSNGRALSPTSPPKKLSMRPRIADIGTGSGALAISAALEIPKSIVTACDIDERCLKVASRNAKKYGVQIDVLAGDLLRPLFHRQQPLDALLANLPYVPSRQAINRAASHEPELAIFGGADGLELYRRMFSQINEMPNKPRLIITESLQNQHLNLTDIATTSGYTHQRTDGLAQLFEYRY